MGGCEGCVSPRQKDESEQTVHKRGWFTKGSPKVILSVVWPSGEFVFENVEFDTGDFIYAIRAVAEKAVQRPVAALMMPAPASSKLHMYKRIRTYTLDSGAFLTAVAFSPCGTFHLDSKNAKERSLSLSIDGSGKFGMTGSCEADHQTGSEWAGTGGPQQSHARAKGHGYWSWTGLKEVSNSERAFDLLLTFEDYVLTTRGQEINDVDFHFERTLDEDAQIANGSLQIMYSFSLTEDRPWTVELRCDRTCETPSRLTLLGLSSVPEKLSRNMLALQPESRQDSNEFLNTYMHSPELESHQDSNDLNTYLHARSRGESPPTPLGYIEGIGVIGHEATGVQLKCQPLQIGSGCDIAEQIILYHYAPRSAFRAITGNRGLTYLVASFGDRAHFGDGVYATQLAPHNFVSTDEILRNNYTNKIDIEEQEEQIKEWRAKGMVEYCIPLIVPRELAVNVNTECTRHMTQPGQTRDGKAIRPGRDIWVITMKHDGCGMAQNAVENISSKFNQLKDTDWSVRKHAVEVLSGKIASEYNDECTTILATLLVDPDPQVRVAVIWSIACSKALKPEQAEEMIIKNIGSTRSQDVKNAIHEAVEFLRCKGSN